MWRTRREVKQCIEEFISGSGGRWEWDDFISITINDPELDLIRLQCSNIPTRYPPLRKDEYCSAEGIIELTRLAESLDDE